MADVMQFPKTWEEFEASYGFSDREEIYTNGSRLIQSFRVEQWLEHIDLKHGKWIKHPGHVVHDEGAYQWKYDDIFECSLCGCKVKESSNYCPNCGAQLEIEL